MSITLRKNVRSNKVMTEGEAAYVAGLVDGEGTICFSSRKSSGRRAYWLTCHLTIANTDWNLLEKVVEITGNGYIRDSGTPKSGQKQGYSWRVGAVQARFLLPQLLPFLVLKHRQAECLLRYGTLLRRGRTEEAFLPEIEALYEEVRHLNQRGVVIARELDWTLRDPKPQSERFCQEEGCSDRTYITQPYCYRHWLQRKEHEQRACLSCGQTFGAIFAWSRFCSDQCQHRHYWKTVAQPREKAAKAQTRQCPGCSQMFTTGSTIKQFCSRQCKSRMRTAVLFARQEGLPEPERLVHAVRGTDVVRRLVCAYCYEGFETTNKLQEYCSVECHDKAGIARLAAKRQAEAEEREQHPCPICGTLVDRSHYKRKTYCSEACQAKGTAQAKPKEKRCYDLACGRCGKEFQYHLKTKRFCSKNCQQLAWEAKKRQETLKEAAD